MYRKEIEELQQWKASANRKPLIIKGARQVGKTWLLKEFGKMAYESVAYINFESSPVMRQVFDLDFDISRIMGAIRIETGVEPIAGKTLIIFDEIQDAPKALTSLKYFAENKPEHHIIAAGSLLGVLLAKGASFPVGKVSFMSLYPMNFTEFLIAIGQQILAETIIKMDWQLIAAYRDKMVDYLKQYYFVGGMPEAVFRYASSKNLVEVRSIQQFILNAYEQDFAKHAPAEMIPRIRMVWNGIPAQLARENKKFIYGQLKQGARAKEFEMALLWLYDCGLIYRVNQVTKPAIPLKAYEDSGSFKLYMLDTGLLAALAGLDAQTILEGNRLFEEFKGALTEQYVLQELIAQKQGEVYYWSPQNTRMEIDFMIQAGKNVVPIEVKAAENLHAKSLRVFCEKYKPAFAVRTSLSDYRKEDWMMNVPLYAAGTIYYMDTP
jgi:predicted AAA+ superfamily ATPase